MIVAHLSREEWGADTSLPRLGPIVAPHERTEIYIHHTVGVDSDATPNVWETWDEIKRWMRRLQTIRPDLGLDVPYNFVVFFAVIDGTPMIVICEGRGWDRRGAHTKYHNRTAIAFGVHGNFMLPTFGLELYLPRLGRWIDDNIPEDMMLIGSVRPDDGRDVWGHRDSGAATSCCGDYLYDRLHLIRVEETEDEDDMPTLEEIKDAVRVVVAEEVADAFAGLRADEFPKAWRGTVQTLAATAVDIGLFNDDTGLFGGIPGDNDAQRAAAQKAMARIVKETNA